MLYFVATPIGNLKDISIRALEILQSVDVIACEDTRKSLILLNHYNIKKRLITYHKNNEQISSNGIINLLQDGKDVAVISDCGMPVISDPGNILVKKLVENNLEYTIIPGANACLSALVLSGLDASRFAFVGFLPEKNKDRTALLNNFKNLSATLIFYVSPHNLTKDVRFLFEILGPRNACFVNEITKMFEKRIYFSLGEELDFIPKGEYVLVVEGAKEMAIFQNLTIEEQIEYYIEMGLTKKEALKKVAKINKIDNIYKVIDQSKK